MSRWFDLLINEPMDEWIRNNMNNIEHMNKLIRQKEGYRNTEKTSHPTSPLQAPPRGQCCIPGLQLHSSGTSVLTLLNSISLPQAQAQLHILRFKTVFTSFAQYHSGYRP